VTDALAQVAERHQVLVITHLPQIAARADQHLVVSKEARGGIATSDVASIHGEDRELELARIEHLLRGQPVRRFKELRYRTLESWSRERRVVAKAEWLEKGRNPRFIVTSLPRAVIDGKMLYEQVYCARGDMENRIKEQQLYLFADRTSAATMRANQVRLDLSSVAYVLLAALRRVALAGTDMARAQCHTIRLKLLKIGALVTITARKVWVSLASGCPYAAIFAAAWRRLRVASG